MESVRALDVLMKENRKLMWKKNDTHGIGIVLLAGTEIKKMREGVKA